MADESVEDLVQSGPVQNEVEHLNIPDLEAELEHIIEDHRSVMEQSHMNDVQNHLLSSFK